MAKLWNQPKCPSTYEWIKKMWCISTKGFCLAFKKNCHLWQHRWNRKKITVLCTIRKTQRHFLMSMGRGWNGGYQMVGAGEAGVMVNGTKPWWDGKIRHPPSLLKCVVQCGESSKQLQLRVIKTKFEMSSRKWFFLLVDVLVCFML